MPQLPRSKMNSTWPRLWLWVVKRSRSRVSREGVEVEEEGEEGREERREERAAGDVKVAAGT